MNKKYLIGVLSSLFVGQTVFAALPAGGPAEAWTGTQIATQSGIIVGRGCGGWRMQYTPATALSPTKPRRTRTK